MLDNQPASLLDSNPYYPHFKCFLDAVHSNKSEGHCKDEPVAVASNIKLNWQKQIQVLGVIIAAIAAIGTLLAGIGAVMDKKLSPPSNPASLSPSASSTKKP